MPLYSFRCDACKHADTVFAPMSEAVPWGMSVRCPKCEDLTFKRQIDAVHTDLQEFHTPIEMFSVAANTKAEVREIQRKCPGVQIEDNPASDNFGIPVVKNRKEKLSVLKAVGYIENN